MPAQPPGPAAVRAGVSEGGAGAAGSGAQGTGRGEGGPGVQGRELGESATGPCLPLLSRARSEWTWEKTGPRGASGRLPRRDDRGHPALSLFTPTSRGSRDVGGAVESPPSGTQGLPAPVVRALTQTGSRRRGYGEAGRCPPHDGASSLQLRGAAGSCLPCSDRERPPHSGIFSSWVICLETVPCDGP